jgi:hypothetical protein
VGGDVSVDSETLLVTDFVNLKIKPAQSFRSDHKNMMHTCVYKNECSIDYSTDPYLRPFNLGALLNMAYGPHVRV